MSIGKKWPDIEKKTPLILLILDGWGYTKDTTDNAITAARTPQWDKWWANCPHLLLEASGTPVGLPPTQMGNSEVGHMHIGAGRRIPQDFTRINEAIADGSYATNKAFHTLLTDVQRHQTTCHVMILLSPGGVHSHEDHLFAFLDLCAKYNVKDISLHLFLDGRDTPPQSALQSLNKLNDCLARSPVATIHSISGRYYAMDRDKRWSRMEPVYRLISEGISEHHFSTSEEAIETFYQQGIYDEFIPPCLIGEKKPIKDGDSVLFLNFRADRARQLTHAFLSEPFLGFARPHKLNIAHFVTMTHYADDLPTNAVFPPLIIRNTLGEVLAQQGLTQLRIAETEKYAHVTFFLNGGKEDAFSHEYRQLIPSPQVATYDLQPEMSAPALTDAIICAMESGSYDVIIGNYANADMVGHTGNFNATVTAIEALDTALQRIGIVLKKTGGQLLITADHGNAEAMFDKEIHQAHTAHTCHPVPFLYVGEGWKKSTSMGCLTDIAPTILTLLTIPIPKEMTGKSLLVNDHVTSN